MESVCFRTEAWPVDSSKTVEGSVGVRERARIREEILLCGGAVNTALDNARDSPAFSAGALLSNISENVVEALLPKKFRLSDSSAMLAAIVLLEIVHSPQK